MEEPQHSQSFFYRMYITVIMPSIGLGLILNCYNLAGSVIAAELDIQNPGLIASFVNDGSVLGMLFGSVATSVFA